MKKACILALYYTLFPIFLLLSLPAYLMKMWKRGGIGSGLLERFGIYRKQGEEAYQGGIYIHAVSVGEAFIAIKFIRQWQKTHDGPVVLAISTSTGHQVARELKLERTCVLYAPLDVPGLPERCLNRFRPQAIALIEAELWPHFARVCNKRSIPIIMLNARLSSRSEGRYAKIKGITSTLFSMLSAMGVQNKKDAQRFAGIGVKPEIITVTGSIKFDVLGDQSTSPRLDYQAMLDAMCQGKPIVLAASTHAGEEALLAQAIRQANAFPLIVPRHAERREEVMRDLRAVGFSPLLRSKDPQALQACDCYVCDTTGELRDWTQLAQVVIIGKSFRAQGGQNPVEAIAARIPVIAGPNMSNFADLVQMLQDAGGIAIVTAEQLSDTISMLLHSPEKREQQCQAAYNSLAAHAGACKRSVQLLEQHLNQGTA